MGKDFLKEVCEKYGIDLPKLEKEQLKLAKQLKLKDSIDFDILDKVAGIGNVFFENKIISAIVVLSAETMEIIEQKYFSDKMKFPYIAGFRAYRELPSMVSAFNLLEEKPDAVFVLGHGILHPRGLGIASHFSLATGVPTIGVADSLICGDVKDDDVILNGKVAGKVLHTKEGAKPLYVSAGNMISLKTSAELTRKFILLPHKLPEPLHLAHKYGKEVIKEIFKV